MEQPNYTGVLSAAELLRQGLEYYRQGAWPQAEACFTAVSEADEAGSSELAAAWHYRANLHYFRGRTDAALAGYRRALEYYRAEGGQAGEAALLFDMSRIYQAAADYRRAYELLGRVVELDRQLDSPDLKSHKIVLGAVRRKLREQGNPVGPTKG